MDQELIDVYNFQVKFGFPNSPRPTLLTTRHIQARIKFLQEELNELKKAADEGNMAKQVDALVDIGYVVKGTALRMGLAQSWHDHWDVVQIANMKKALSTDADRGHKGWIIKPPGWRAPDHEAILQAYGFTNGSLCDDPSLGE